MEAVVPPLKPSDALRLRYIVQAEGVARESGVLESGSWAALAMTRIANRVDRDGCLITPQSRQRTCGAVPAAVGAAAGVGVDGLRSAAL
ncbi:MAG: hypothetical protein CMH57_01925, partial [Myxococcales bacterium]|nr:hypothetical protein [Myxococcales bacterium]